MHKTIKKWKLISEITSTFLFWGKCFFGIYLIHVFYRTIVFGILGSWELSINQIIEAVQNDLSKLQENMKKIEISLINSILKNDESNKVIQEKLLLKILILAK